MRNIVKHRFHQPKEFFAISNLASDASAVAITFIFHLVIKNYAHMQNYD